MEAILVTDIVFYNIVKEKVKRNLYPVYRGFNFKLANYLAEKK